MEPVILILPSQSICIHHILYTSGLQDSDSLCSKAWIRMTASKLHKKQVNKGRFHILSPTSSLNFCVRRRGKPPRKIRRRGKPPMLAAARDLYWVSAGLVCLMPPPRKMEHQLPLLAIQPEKYSKRTDSWRWL